MEKDKVVSNECKTCPHNIIWKNGDGTYFCTACFAITEITQFKEKV